MSGVGSRIIVALDFSTVELARDFVRQIDPSLCRLKIGNILFTQSGPQFVEELMRLGFDVFLDLKYHDIPQTVAGACRAAAELGVWMVNVHTQGGKDMLEAACDALVPFQSKPLLIGVTVLTSLNDHDLKTIGCCYSAKDMVLRMAGLAKVSGIDGVVCSSQEAGLLREHFDADFKLVTPGIRLEGSEKDDQKRILTPNAAIRAGASYLVIGRPITRADNPLLVLHQISNQLP